MGFSPLGLLLATLVLLPNGIMLVLPPRGDAVCVHLPRWSTMLERIGQGACLAAAAFIAPAGLIPAAGALALLLLLVYYGGWIRYLSSGRRWSALFDSWGPVPVPMAIVPVLVFALGAAWLLNAWLAVSAVLLGIGHITNSIFRARVLWDGVAD